MDKNDLIPGVTRVRLRLAAINVFGIVGPSYNLRSSHVPVLLGEGERHLSIDTIEIVENPPVLDPFPVGTKVKLIKLDPRHEGVGVAAPTVGLIGEIDETTAPKWCQTVRFKMTDLGYTDADEGETARLFILRNCLEEHVPVNDALKAIMESLKKGPPEFNPDTYEPMFNREAIIDARGHWGKTEPFARGTMELYHGKHFDDNVKRAMLFTCIDMEEHGLVKEETTQLFFNSSECYVCQGRFGFIPADEGMRFTASTECPYPGGIPDYDVLLGVPSGKIVFANDLRPLVEIEEPRGTTVNSMIGQRRHTEAHAAAGLILISTGNTGPGVWKRPDGTLSVANFRERDPEWGEEGVVTPVEERGEHLGDIDTELWDFSAMDHDHFMERCVALQEYPASFGITVVDVQPGTWAFTVPQNTGRDTATEIFSNARWTDLEAPVVHVIDTSVAASLEESHAWKTLTDAWSYGFSENGYKTLEYLLIVIGNGYDWTDGLLRSGTRREDAPFRSLDDKMLDQPLSLHPLDGEIPVWPNFAYPVAESAFEKMRVVSTMYPLSLDYARAAIIPANADPHWLAVTTMYVKAMKDRVDLFSDQHSDPKKNQDGMNLIYGMLLDLIEQRGIETMRPYFAEWLAKDAELLEKNPPQ